MKNYKGLKITLIICIIILLSMISFGGIYIQDKNSIKNILPNYLLSKELEGYRKIELKVSDEIEETTKYDANGNVIAEDDTQTEVARTEEKKVNEEEILTQENYEKSKKIVEKRLNSLQVVDYTIKQNKETGNIMLEIPENANTDRVVGQLSLQGKFEVIDNDTNEVLMTNSDLDSIKAGYGTGSSGNTSVFINFQFNKEGTEKLKNITNTYTKTTVTKEATEEGQEPTTETVTKQIAIKIDDSTLLTTYFEEEISNGLIQLSVGNSSNSSAEELQESMLEATSMVSVLKAGKLPIVYEVEQNKYVYSDIAIEQIFKAISIVAIIFVIGIIFIIIKYHLKGVLASISFIGYIAILLISLRYFNVEISIASLIGILISIFISYLITTNILKQNETMQVLKKYLIILIPSLIIAVVFTFYSLSIGITLFWGITICMLYHLVVTKNILNN